MATKAKLDGNARYLAKFKTLSVRIPLEELPDIQKAAGKAGQSVPAYLLDAARQRMQQEGK